MPDGCVFETSSAFRSLSGWSYPPARSKVRPGPKLSYARPMAQKEMAVAPNNIGTRNGTLVSGHMDQKTTPNPS